MDTDSSEDLSKKLEKVLNGFLAQGCKLIDDVYLEMLITHMSGKTGERKIYTHIWPLVGVIHGWYHFLDYTELKKSAFVRDWIGKAATQIENNSQQCDQLCAFTLRLMTILFADEWQFMNIIETDICLR